MMYQFFIFLFYLLSSLLTIHGMESGHVVKQRLTLVEHLEQQAEKIQNITTFVNPPVIASNNDLFKAFSSVKNYSTFRKGLNLSNYGKEIAGISVLTQLAKKDDHAPSKYLLAFYYDNKNLKELSQKSKLKLQQKKFESEQWLIEAVNSQYPPAQFYYGKRLFKKGRIDEGLGYITDAAQGTRIEVVPCDTETTFYSWSIPYFYLPAVEFLKTYYVKNCPDLGAEWYAFECYIKAAKRCQ